LIDSSFITFVALIIAVVALSIYLFRQGRSMGWWERVGLVGLAVYFPFVLGLTLGGIPIDEGALDPSEWMRWANLIPFATIGPQIDAGLGSGVRQLVGNLIILIPLGFGLPMVWRRFRRIGPTLLAGFAVALSIELAQLLISLMVGVPYRAFDVDDLILNTAGAVIGWLAWRVTLGLIQDPGAPTPQAKGSGQAHETRARSTDPER
jgi:glycopeptide antibiotics resistance protein